MSNILKCHPPGNRDPKEEEKEACISYLKYEMFLLKPKVVVCLGRVAAQRIISPDFKITTRAWNLDIPQELCADRDVSSLGNPAGSL